MRLILLFYSFLFLFHCSVNKSFCENKEIKKNIDKIAPDDSSRIINIINQAKKFQKSKPDTCFKLFSDALEITEKHKSDKKFMLLNASVLLEKGLTYYLIRNYDEAQKAYDESINIVLKNNEGKQYKGDFLKLLAKAYFFKGFIDKSKGDFDEANKWFMKSLTTYQNVLVEEKDKSEIQKEISRCYNNLGDISLYKGKYDIATGFYFTSLKIKEEVKDSIGLPGCYVSIGLVYNEQKDYQKALEYFQLALNHYEKFNDKIGISRCYTNIGGSLTNLATFCLDASEKVKKIESAKDYFLKSLSLKKETGDKRGELVCYNNLGNIYSDLVMSKYGRKSLAKDYDPAIDYYLKSLTLSEELQDWQGVISGSCSIADLYSRLYDLKTGNSGMYLNKMVLYGNKAYDLSVKTGYLTGINLSSSILMKAYIRSGNTKLAEKFSELYISTRDSLFSQEKTNAVADMEAKYEAEKKQLFIDQMHQKQMMDKKIIEAEQEKNKKQFFIIIFSISILLVVLIFLIVLYRMLQHKKKSNILLQSQKIEIKQKADEIEAQRDYLEQMNHELEKLSIVASSTDNSVVLADNTGMIYWVNEGFTKLFGYSFYEFLTQYGNNLIETSSNPDITSIVNDCIASKQSVIYVSEKIAKDGNHIWTQTTLTPVINETGVLTTLVAIDSDITKIKKAEAEITRKNIQITDSLNYAKLIQQALLPSHEFIKNYFPDYFVFYQPRDIVSGDFYWIAEVDGKLMLAVVDCTGHGVPGAFMSMIGITLLNEIVKGKKITDPAQVLTILNESIRAALKQSGSDEHELDNGMDVSLCCINKEKSEVVLSLANQNAYVFNNNDVIVYNGEFCSVGSTLYNNYQSFFTNINIPFGVGMSIYLSTDGFYDQFGGTNDTKFLTSRFKSLLLQCHSLEFSDQYNSIKNSFESWKGTKKQTDDVTVFGIHVE